MSHLVGNISYCIRGIKYMTKYALPVGVCCRPVPITCECFQCHSQIVDALLDGGETCMVRETIISCYWIPHIIVHNCRITGKEPVNKTEIQGESRSPMCLDPNEAIDNEIEKVIEEFVNHHQIIDCKFTGPILVREVFLKGSMTKRYAGCLTTIN